MHISSFQECSGHIHDNPKVGPRPVIGFFEIRGWVWDCYLRLCTVPRKGSMNQHRLCIGAHYAYFIPQAGNPVREINVGFRDIRLSGNSFLPWPLRAHAREVSNMLWVTYWFHEWCIDSRADDIKGGHLAFHPWLVLSMQCMLPNFCLSAHRARPLWQVVGNINNVGWCPIVDSRGDHRPWGGWHHVPQSILQQLHLVELRFDEHVFYNNKNRARLALDKHTVWPAFTYSWL